MILLLFSAICVPVNAAVPTIRDTMKALQSIPVEDMDTTVPTAARPLLTNVKHQLRDGITDILNRNPASMDQLQNNDRLTAYLHSEMLKRGLRFSNDGGQEGPYGYQADATMERPEGHRKLLVVTTTVGIMCGSDDSLYVYQQNGTVWTLILSLEANDYQEISSAQFNMKVAVSPPDENNNFFVSIAHTTAWCTSNWQGLQIKTLRPGSDPYSPKVLFSGSESVFLGDDDPYRISATRDTFTLRFIGSDLDSDLLTRPCIQKFKVDKDHVKRIAPVALRAQDFLEEWINRPWTEVSEWDRAADLNDAQSWHETLHNGIKDFFVSYDFVQKCGDTNRWQIGLDFELSSDKKQPQTPLPETLYFTVAKDESTFHIASIDRQRPDGCPGEDPAEEWSPDQSPP